MFSLSCLVKQSNQEKHSSFFTFGIYLGINEQANQLLVDFTPVRLY